MQNQAFARLNSILREDRKTSTYKFALLRGTIEIVQEFDHFCAKNENDVEIPFGLLIEKWILYYYPLLACEQGVILQANKQEGKNDIAFRPAMSALIQYYKSKGGLSVFANDFRRERMDEQANELLRVLVNELRDIIFTMPMKYIGSNASGNYTIFKGDKFFQKFKQGERVTQSALIQRFGVFSIPLDIFEAFQYLGSFLLGTDSIMFAWAKFSAELSGNSQFGQAEVWSVLQQMPNAERDVLESKKAFENLLKAESQLFCVWSGKPIQNLAIDHVLPFAIWKNNDLWNLLPAESKVNGNKSDKIPSLKLLKRQEPLIVGYWQKLRLASPIQFDKDLRHGLLRPNLPNFEKTWEKEAMDSLRSKCDYLIHTRGLEEWKHNL